jgi:putative FmdB family regulatory protein
MPMYTYTCERCHKDTECVVSYDQRDAPIRCACGGALRRHGVEPFKTGKPPYQMKAVMSDGSHVAGHFGKDARRKR